MVDEETRLVYGDWEAGFAPALGGALLYLRRRGADMLRPAPSLEAARQDPRNAACFPCVPYFGRLARGLDFAGRHFDLAPTLPACDPDNAIHGEGWVSPWRIVEQTPASLTARFDYAPQRGRFPFPYRAEQKLTLDASGFAATLSIENAGPSPMPAGLGLHPYFRRTSQTRLAFSAGNFWTPPDGPLAPPPDALGSEAAPLPAATRDDTYAGFGGRVAIEDGRRRVVLASDAPALHLFAPACENFFCLEPVTHLPGAFVQGVSGPGARSLSPGERLSLDMFVGGD